MPKKNDLLITPAIPNSTPLSKNAERITLEGLRDSEYPVGMFVFSDKLSIFQDAELVNVFRYAIQGYERVYCVDGSTVISLILADGEERPFKETLETELKRIQHLYRADIINEPLTFYFWRWAGTEHGAEHADVCPKILVKGRLMFPNASEDGFSDTGIRYNSRFNILVESEIESWQGKPGDMRLECYYNSQWNWVASLTDLRDGFMNFKPRADRKRGLWLEFVRGTNLRTLEELVVGGHRVFRVVEAPGIGPQPHILCKFKANKFFPDLNFSRDGWFDVDRIFFHGCEARDMIREKEMAGSNMLLHLQQRRGGEATLQVLATKFSGEEIAKMTPDFAASFVAGALGVPFDKLEKLFAVHKLFTETAQKTRTDGDWFGVGKDDDRND